MTVWDVGLKWHSLIWKSEMTVWDDSLKWQPEMTAWYGNLRWQFRMTAWDDSLRWQFDMTVWYDSLRWQFEMTDWDYSLRWQFEMTISICKGGLITESFSRWLQSPKKCAKNYPEHLFFRWIQVRIFFGRLEPTWKTFCD